MEYVLTDEWQFQTPTGQSPVKVMPFKVNMLKKKKKEKKEIHNKKKEEKKSLAPRSPPMCISFCGVGEFWSRFGSVNLWQFHRAGELCNMITRGGCPRASGVAVGLHVYATRHSKPPVMSCYQKDEIVDSFFFYFFI